MATKDTKNTKKKLVEVDDLAEARINAMYAKDIEKATGIKPGGARKKPTAKKK